MPVGYMSNILFHTCSSDSPIFHYIATVYSDLYNICMNLCNILV